MSLRTRSIVVVGIVLLTLFLAFPSFFTREQRLASPWIPDLGLNLGLDLQGGVHWLLRIDTDTAVKQELENDVAVLRDLVADEKLGDGVGVELVGQRIEVRADAATLEKLRPKIEEFQSLRVESTDGMLRLQLQQKWLHEVVQRATLQAQEVLRRRVDDIGVNEPVIAPQGEGRILVQLPGDVDPARARPLIEKTTFLQFKKVLASAENEELLRARLADGVPEDAEIVASKNQLDKVSEAFLVPKAAMLTGSMLEDARLDFDRRNLPVVAFTWNAEGTRIFREFTGDNIGQRLAAIIDGEVITAPVIQARIGKRGVIEGRFTRQEAADLAVKLRSGALPIPLVIEEERAVGPALGADSIRQGVRATILGALGVFAFMGVYYSVPGWMANVTVVLNLAMIIAAMGLAGATLTLPGIAGMVLTMGMAVDANVIIYERIREELRAGKTPRNSVTAGFRRSALTILDSNLTTLIAALVLLYFGRGPVQGFGVTLALGIGTSLFCALIVTHLLLDQWLASGRRTLRL